VVRLETLTLIAAPVERCFDLARSVEVHLAGNVHSGESAVAAAGVTTGLIGMAQQVTWRARHFGILQTLTSEITAMEGPFYFRDTMMAGAFRWMHHDHLFQPTATGATEMKDVFCFAAPLGWLGRIAEWAVLRRYMEALLRERNLALKRIAESAEWRRYV
jgi:ligand-binding SRPBCC domain-containing protein